MARLPKNPEEAVALLGVREEGTVVAAGPDNGYAEGIAEAVGTKGTVYVRFPPPDLTARKKAIQIVEELPDAKADQVVVWIGTVAVHELGEYCDLVAKEGTLWVVIPKVDPDLPRAVTEGDVRKALMVRGWRETKNVPLSTNAFAVRFHRRR